MRADLRCKLWEGATENFFRDRLIQPIQQGAQACVPTVLAMLTGTKPEKFLSAAGAEAEFNTQNPVTWSDALGTYGMRLAYCPADVRKLEHYLGELIALDDLFTLSYYTTDNSNKILGDPNEHGWVTGSHVVILHRDKIIDPQTGTTVNALEHGCKDKHTKRIFRVVPAGSVRRL